MMNDVKSCWVDISLVATLYSLYFHSLEVVSRYFDQQLQGSENDLYVLNLTEQCLFGSE